MLKKKQTSHTLHTTPHVHVHVHKQQLNQSVFLYIVRGCRGWNDMSTRKIYNRMENWKRARDAHTKLYRELCADQQIYTVSMTVNDDDYGGGGGGGINDCMESAMARQKKQHRK